MREMGFDASGAWEGDLGNGILRNGRAEFVLVWQGFWCVFSQQDPGCIGGRGVCVCWWV